ncbi:hypothetical protein AAW14_34075 [Streptomyces hygroscopicus]|uniref:WXG100 family type VII secretion target n=1 Tax=Streptomyces hygroscopicus TaxID=1912 RepID=UPI00223EB672|nr:hypothetical protein [Streptomyces hygroscopicus]MCW7946871.1 hypothetical protein [Streptomyces hygroscopicus]
MGDNQKQQDPHKAELGQADAEVGAIDAVMVTSQALSPFGLAPGIRFGKTSFEKHRLNDMIDMVESANPEHLETAGRALWDARDAINDAADELGGHIGRVQWEGASGNAFRDWSNNLVNTARGIATFAEHVGTQITAAGSGLASVRKSMPPRDDRLMAKDVQDFPVVAQVDSNTEYQAALKVEGHRQEAINQMNRLASFYAVSEESLRAQQVPTFGPMPDVGVPRPVTLREVEPPSEGGTARLAAAGPAARESGTMRHQSVDTTVGRVPEETLEPSKKLHDSVAHADQHVGTNIDSVGTLPPVTAQPAPTVTPPTVTGPSVGSGGPTPPFATGPIPPAIGVPTGRTPGFGRAGGTRGPLLGRVADPAGETSGARGPLGQTRGPLGPVGRAEASGETGLRGPASAVGKTPTGRSVTGGIPKVGGTPAGRVGSTPIGRVGGTGATGAARTGGVVGGKPTTEAAQGATGSRIPRGTVIGGEAASKAPRGSEGLGRRGVIGAAQQEGTAGGQTTRRSASASDGVVGTAKSKSSGARKSAFTAADTGPERAPIGNRGSGRAGGKGPSRDERSVRDGKGSSRKQRRDEPSATD